MLAKGCGSYWNMCRRSAGDLPSSAQAEERNEYWKPTLCSFSLIISMENCIVYAGCINAQISAENFRLIASSARTLSCWEQHSQCSASRVSLSACSEPWELYVFECAHGCIAELEMLKHSWSLSWITRINVLGFEARAIKRAKLLLKLIHASLALRILHC